jgi:hypothetical protein
MIGCYLPTIKQFIQLYKHYVINNQGNIFTRVFRYALNDKKYSPMDLILFLKEIRKVKINDQWHNAEITAKTGETAQQNRGAYYVKGEKLQIKNSRLIG